MSLSSRELTLVWVTATAVLLGCTFWLGETKVQEWKETYKVREKLGKRAMSAQRMVDQREEWVTELDTERAKLPLHPASKDVTAELLKTLEQTAQDHGLILLKREPKPEEGLGDLYEVAINCTWEGELKALTHFLYAIHNKGVIFDIRQLSVSPVQGQKGRLKGSFIVVCAFARESASATQASGGNEPWNVNLWLFTTIS